MEKMDTPVRTPSLRRPEQGPSRNGTPGVVQERVRVDGKFFARGAQRLRIQGVTYGPFAPNEAGEPFPTPERVGDDFTAMHAAGINAIRTYHVPPSWFLHQADEQGVGVFVDVPWRKHLCFLDCAEAQ